MDFLFHCLANREESGLLWGYMASRYVIGITWVVKTHCGAAVRTNHFYYPVDEVLKITSIIPMLSKKYIIGIDEVGRGALAGPVTVGAVALKVG